MTVVAMLFTSDQAFPKIATPAKPDDFVTRFLTLWAVLLTGTLCAAQEKREPTLALEDCRIRADVGFPGIKARCGTFVRPENPADPESPDLALFVAVVPALSLEPEPDAFVPIAGGPGQSSVSFYASLRAAFEDVRRTRDIVLLDQRGTGQSAPLTCDVDADVLGVTFSAEETRELTEQCLDELPHDPRFFTTSIAVGDLEALREALGYTQFNIYGVSYGSRVAQHYLRQFPTSARTIVIDGVVAPQMALGPDVAIQAQGALDRIFDRCEENDACNARFSDLRNEFLALNEQLADQPVQLALAMPASGKTEEVLFGTDQMAGALRLLSYSPTTIATIPLLISEAVNGNYQPLAAQYLMVAESLSESLNIGMHNAVVCSEDAPWFDNENISRAQLDATYIGPVQLDSLAAMCSVWPRGVVDDRFREPVSSDVPVLLLSGEADPITPPAYADRAAVNLENALHLTGRNQGHGLAPRGCTPGIIGDFVDTASVENLDTECLDRVHAMPFFLDFSGPSP